MAEGGKSEDSRDPIMIFRVADGPDDQFRVIRYRGTEGLCQLYRFEIELTTTETDVWRSIEGKPAVLLAASGTATRSYYGVVGKFEVVTETKSVATCRAELVPGLWLLTHRYNSQVFAEQTTQDIVTTVVTAAGIRADQIRFDLDSSHKPRDYCVQYRETDYNFICRLMEEEGMWWYFEQPKAGAEGGGPQGDTLVVADSEKFYADIDPPPEGIERDWKPNELPFVPPSHLQFDAERVSRFRLGRAVRPGHVLLNDFNFEKPGLKLWSEGDAGRDPSLEFCDYPGGYSLQAGGTTVAKLRSQEFETGRTVGIGVSDCHRIFPGRTFTLVDHPNNSFNDSYLVTRITHYGSQVMERATGGFTERGGAHDSTIANVMRAAQQHKDEAVRDLAAALIELSKRLGSGDPTAHRTLTEWIYHAGQVSQDLAAVGAALGANPMEALALPNLLDDGHAGQVNDFEEPLYECRFECIPASVVYRPPRVTPWPVMRGCQTARVVGEGDDDAEEIVTDKYGRVKVLFHWDRRGHAGKGQSCWVRVAQGSAGGGYGMLFLPRIGHEVVVDFLEGNPDKPIIIGCVFNNDNMPPYELPKEKTKSVIKTNSTPGAKGFNEIRFEDKKDKEQIFTHAQKDHDLRVENDAKEWVGHDKHLIVENDRFDHIKKDHHEIIDADYKGEVGGDAHEYIEGNHIYETKGDVAFTVSGSRNEKITKDDETLIDGNRSLKVGETLSTKADKIQLVVGSNFGVDTAHFDVKASAGAVIECPGGICLKAGGSFISVTSSAVIISGPMVKINSGGSAVSAKSVQATAPIPGDQPEKPAESLEADTSKPGEDKIKWPTGPETPQAEALKNAAAVGAPFCALCEEAKKKQEEEKAKEEPPLEVESAEAKSARKIEITFNEDIDPTCLQDADKSYLRGFSIDDTGRGTLARNPHEAKAAGKKVTLTWNEGDMVNGLPVRVKVHTALHTPNGEPLNQRTASAIFGGKGIDPITFEGIKVATSRSIQLLFSKEVATEDIVFDDDRKIHVVSPTLASRYQVEIMLPNSSKGKPDMVTVFEKRITLHFQGRPFADGQRLVVFAKGRVWDKDGLSVAIDNDTDAGEQNPFVAENVSIGSGGGTATDPDAGS